MKKDNFLIEFVLNQDATASYTGFVDKLKNGLMASLVEEIKKQYPGSRFGVTAFGDWTSRTLKANDMCYTFYSPLTPNLGDFMLKFQGIKMGDGGDTLDSSLMGMSLSVTDPKMGWSFQQRTSENKRIVKVVVTITDAESLMPNDIWFGYPFEGSHQDSCSMKPPSPELVGKVFRDNNVFFLGLISGVERAWQDYLHRMYSNGFIKSLDIGTPEQLKKTVLEGLEQIICFILSETTTTKASIPFVPVVVGASVGGLALLSVAGGGAYYMYRSKRKVDVSTDPFDEDFEISRLPSDESDVQPPGEKDMQKDQQADGYFS